MATAILWFLLGFCHFTCKLGNQQKEEPTMQPFVVVLGIAQDAGFPQAGCRKACCRAAWEQQEQRKMVSCLGIVDPNSGQAWMLDATPDFREQLRRLENILPNHNLELAGIFLTHAHIGHYTGLVHLGREVMGAKGIPAYAMPRMQTFLKSNGPWSQLVSLGNIELCSLKADSTIILNNRIKVTPYQVPHRDEFSETVGYKIQGINKSLLFIPDIDKWHLWERDIIQLVGENDYALLDGSFFQNGEIPGRDMSEIPHPFILESLEKFENESASEKNKIHFIHFNHTNPVLLENSKERNDVVEKGFNLAYEGQLFTI